MQQKGAPESSTYLFEEESGHEKPGKGPMSSESLTSLRTDLARFYRLDQKLRSINRVSGADDPSKTVERLNGILKRGGIGGTNGSEESKAYFVTNGKEVVLVANTVVEGREVRSREAVYEAFAKIDRLLADPFTDVLRDGEERVRAVSSAYAEQTNDLRRVGDVATNVSGATVKLFGFKGWE